MPCCKEFEDAIWEAAETRAVPAALERHVRECGACRACLQGLSGALKGLAELREIDAPVPSAAVRMRLDETPRRVWVVRRLAVATAVCCGVVVLAALAVRKLPPADSRRVTVSVPHGRAAIVEAREPVRPIAPAAISQREPVMQAQPAVRMRANSRVVRARPAKRVYARGVRLPVSNERAQVVVTSSMEGALSPESEMEEPRWQFTVVVAEAEKQPVRRHSIFDPTYCALVLPEVRSSAQPGPQTQPWHREL
jgi:hypothetical protein